MFHSTSHRDIVARASQLQLPFYLAITTQQVGQIATAALPVVFPLSSRSRSDGSSMVRLALQSWHVTKMCSGLRFCKRISDMKDILGSAPVQRSKLCRSPPKRCFKSLPPTHKRGNHICPNVSHRSKMFLQDLLLEFP